MSTWIKHYNHNHSPVDGKFVSGGRVLSKEEKKEKKLAKKWNYIEPENKKEAQKHIAKTALRAGLATSAINVGSQAYVTKKIMNKPIKTAFNKKTAKSAAIQGILMAAGNMAYDEILYSRKGVIRK